MFVLQKKKKLALSYTHTFKITGFSSQLQVRHWSTLLWLVLSHWIQMLWIINQLFWQVSNNETRHAANNDSPFVLSWENRKGRWASSQILPRQPTALGNPFHLLSHQQNQCICWLWHGKLPTCLLPFYPEMTTTTSKTISTQSIYVASRAEDLWEAS